MTSQKIFMNENTRRPEALTNAVRLKNFANKLFENKEIIIAGAGAGLLAGVAYVLVRGVEKSLERAIKK